MEAKSICIFEKHGGCKKTDCKFHHPIEDCEDETCDIRSCQKRHPQVCLYHTVFNSCKFNQNCKFLHKATIKNVYETKIEALEEKYSKLEEKYSKLEERHCKLFKEMVIIKVDTKESLELGNKLGQDMVLVMNWQEDYDIRHGYYDDDEETQMTTEDFTEAENDINVSDMEQERDDENQDKTIAVIGDKIIASKHLPKNDFHNLNYSWRQ